MYSRFFHLCSFILLFMIQTLNASDYYLFSPDTGYTSEHAYDRYGRKWSWPLDRMEWNGIPVDADANVRDGMIDPTPFAASLTCEATFSLRFQIEDPGHKYVRLYFYTASYADLDISRAHFTVRAGEKVLLDFPNPGDDYLAHGPRSVVLEFSVPVQSDHLTLTFGADSEFQDSFAFINGVEIVPHPNIYAGPKSLVGNRTPFVIDNQILENVARVNVGGEEINILDDSGKLYRFWDKDERFLRGQSGVTEDAREENVVLTYPPPNFSEFVAPKILYQTARTMGPDYDNDNSITNMEWRFPVDSDQYYYMVRLHFCEIRADVEKVNESVFDIYINGELAESGADVIAWTGKPGVPIYKDYVLFLADSAKSQIWINLSPDTHSDTRLYDTLLNGIEIFKISDDNGNLDRWIRNRENILV